MPHFQEPRIARTRMASIRPPNPRAAARDFRSPQFAFNMVQAGYFRRYGFLYAIVVRLVFYMIWHVLTFPKSALADKWLMRGS